jgi:hypothetical protein
MVGDTEVGLLQVSRSGESRTPSGQAQEKPLRSAELRIQTWLQPLEEQGLVNRGCLSSAIMTRPAGRTLTAVTFPSTRPSLTGSLEMTLVRLSVQ